MSIVRVGSTQKFSDNWDNIFSGTKAAPGKKSGGKKDKESNAAKGAKSAKKKKLKAKKAAPAKGKRGAKAGLQ